MFLPKFLARGNGHIVNTASVAGLFPFAGSRMPYAAAKAANISLTQNLAIYLEPKGIRVSCLIPGPVMTEVSDAMTSWTTDAQMRGPGIELELTVAEDVALTLADGMRDCKILTPTHEIAWAVIERWALRPDAFLRERIEEFAAGRSGRPHVSEAMRERARAKGITVPHGATRNSSRQQCPGLQFGALGACQ
ncbi:MAG TPA: SDR family oxidoreductase [Paraburkholderia sp.]|uniref:SDR family oxidoreductase n=1 Tax=Paraburkholderia sp. TaxID=1926495 RepID=UPI002B4A14FB|nr:SDR family oxidoreductase [Paraburkholderia sp.]HKR39794.1 SDR family oxidoreductase [Paraburkholderia sp.]